eukprot:COSAG02_NODE_14666_length_1250_cov_1.137272_1_plen_102_part_00
MSQPPTSEDFSLNALPQLDSVFADIVNLTEEANTYPAELKGRDYTKVGRLGRLTHGVAFSRSNRTFNSNLCRGTEGVDRKPARAGVWDRRRLCYSSKVVLS